MENNFKYIFFIFLCLSIVFFSCSKPILKYKNLDCPTPVFDCNQSKWEGIGLDTNIRNDEETPYKYVVKRVKGLDTDINEYSIGFIDSKTGYLTLSGSDNQKLIKVNRKTVDIFTKATLLSYEHQTHYGALSYENDNRVYFSSTRYPTKDDIEFLYTTERVDLDKSIGISRLFSADLVNNKLENIEELNTNLNSNYDYLIFESHPSISSNGKYLFFSSDREGSKGGTDIWYMIKENDKWIGPINCGIINTDCDDMTPFVSVNNTLYFSSMGHESVGGFDIFKTEFSINNDGFLKFEKAINIGTPINSEYDEIFPSQSKPVNEEVLYFSSNRRKDDFDIFVKYKTYIGEFEKDEISEDFEFELEGKVVDKETNEGIEGVEVTVKEGDIDDVLFEAWTDKYGDYKFILVKGKRYLVTAKSDSLFYDQFEINIDKKDTIRSISKDLKLASDKIIRINFEYDRYDAPIGNVIDSNGIETGVSWQDAIDELASNIKESAGKLKYVLLTGHTDPIGSNAYNDNLGLNRAKFVLEQLVLRGVSRELLSAESKGKRMVLERRENESEEVYHLRLRRVVFKKFFKE